MHAIHIFIKIKRKFLKQNFLIFKVLLAISAGKWNPKLLPINNKTIIY